MMFVTDGWPANVPLDDLAAANAAIDAANSARLAEFHIIAIFVGAGSVGGLTPQSGDWITAS